ncbi:MAG: hypothetical protein ABWK53_00670 [Anaerolineales bacterium]
MDALAEFERRLPAAQRLLFYTLDSPAHIQAYLDSLPYIAEELDRSPLRVMTDGQAHCLDGALFAAAALRRLGFPPLILDLVPLPGKDDDHVLALYRLDGLWGAVAKSNYAGLRFREPIHRTLRELVLTYFEHYYNLEGEKTLRAYTRPLDLARFDACGWMWDEEGVKQASRALYALKTLPLFPPEVAARLSPVDARSYAAGTVGTDFDWAFGRRSNP